MGGAPVPSHDPGRGLPGPLRAGPAPGGNGAQMTAWWPRRRVTRGSPDIPSARTATVGSRAVGGVVEPPADGGHTAETAQPGGGEGIAGTRRVISLRLEHLGELFNPPQADLFNHDRRYYYATGIDFALSELPGAPLLPPPGPPGDQRARGRDDGGRGSGGGSRRQELL